MCVSVCMYVCLCVRASHVRGQKELHSIAPVQVQAFAQCTVSVSSNQGFCCIASLARVGRVRARKRGVSSQRFKYQQETRLNGLLTHLICAHKNCTTSPMMLCLVHCTRHIYINHQLSCSLACLCARGSRCRALGHTSVRARSKICFMPHVMCY